MLEAITEFIKTEISNSIFENPQNDGRLSSALIEATIIEKIKERFDIKVPGIRSWYDFSFQNEPVNIKISTFASADNLSSKKGMAYALTGIKGEVFSDHWDKFHNLLFDNIADTDKDYYFLVLKKNDIQSSFFSSLKTIGELVPSGNNLPFQCKWSKNTTRVHRPYPGNIQYILSVYCDSWKRSVSPFLNLKEKVGSWL